MEKYIFDFDHYHDYLLSRLGLKVRRTGIKSELARALRCQPSFLSQVFAGKADLSPEQAISVNRFFCHSKDEGEYFLFLVLLARAGTTELRDYFSAHLEEIRQKRLLLSKRLAKPNGLTHEQRSIYYSSWHYAAIHIATTIPELQSRDAIAGYFDLSREKVASILEFLTSAGLVVEQGGALRTGLQEIFIGTDSELILKHHANWRIRALEALDRESRKDLHYSGVFSLSKKDAEDLKKKFIRMIEDALEVIKASREEELYTLTMDFFSMRKKE